MVTIARGGSRVYLNYQGNGEGCIILFIFSTQAGRYKISHLRQYLNVSGNLMKEPSEIWLELPNGGQIAKSYLVKCIATASEEKGYRKVKFVDVYPDENSHGHCEICSQVVSSINEGASIDTAYYSNETWVCPACYSLFIDTDDLIEAISQLRQVG
jgi:hypothetical protein